MACQLETHKKENVKIQHIQHEIGSLKDMITNLTVDQNKPMMDAVSKQFEALENKVTDMANTVKDNYKKLESSITRHEVNLSHVEDELKRVIIDVDGVYQHNYIYDYDFYYIYKHEEEQ